ncbi:efflux RND transporter periplasmic adaptor subunit [Rhodohalobacter mucosus]|uniref:efflux RND transporter periplasmic adaptor subunit n=1 Tax=Rhodohalobacter mucosus TaxID=2079485 RepID=UPI001FA8977B|nr:efflux RND transporter periplasmic adaptor subunit [Rhodohalobacter mucosus]
MKQLILLPGALLLLFALSSCGSDSSESGPQFQRGGNFGNQQATSVEVVPVQTETISEQIRAFGTIRAQDVVSITPQVSNRVVRILADLGDNVSSGQVLAEIYDVPYRDAVEQAEAQIRQARVNLERDSTQFERQRELFERDLISRAEYDNVRSTYLSSRAQYESALAALTQSQENLENTKVKSPVNGVILSRSIAEGDIAGTGQSIYEIANLSGFETRVYLPMQDWENVQAGQQVSLSLSSRSSEIATGVVSRISPQLDPTTGLGEVVVTITNTSTSIYQGALVQSRINLITRQNAVVIPRSAMVEKVETYIAPETGTIELERTYSAFVNQGDSIAVQRDLVLGIQQGDRIEILDGLRPGEGLIVTGQGNLQDESRIRVAGANAQSAQRMDTDTSDESAENRPNLQNMTPEERQQFRERMQNLSPEERQRVRQEMRENGSRAERRQSDSSNR